MQNAQKAFEKLVSTFDDCQKYFNLREVSLFPEIEMLPDLYTFEEYFQSNPGNKVIADALDYGRERICLQVQYIQSELDLFSNILNETEQEMFLFSF